MTGKNRGAMSTKGYKEMQHTEIYLIKKKFTQKKIGGLNNQ